MNILQDNLWYEKHRPTFKEMVLKKKHRLFFKKCMRKKDIPHLLFTGPPGTGKTTLALILIHKVAGMHLILNASSNDRGIATIKNKVKQFARAQSKGLNIVLFDEADGLTPDAQFALKNTIEQYHANCRFIFTANVEGKVIDPIFSRCMHFKFTTEQFGPKQLLRYLKQILESEDVEYKTKDVKRIIREHEPDVRSIINNLQYSSFTGKLEVDKTMGSKAKGLKAYLDSGHIGAIRGVVLNGETDFVWLFRYLFDKYIPEMEQDQQSDAAIVVADYLHRNSTVADKEINAATCLIELMNIMELEIDFESTF